MLRDKEMIDYSDLEDVLEIVDSQSDDFYQAVLVEEDWEKMMGVTRSQDFADWILEEDVPDPNSVLCCIWAPEDPIVITHQWRSKCGEKHEISLRYF
ncbi:hypothetical protein [Moorena sp. SIO3I8]|uniref:hypothetical protein n=1 Tax=Moorena sp. SIO3I8 TaxID=2607833 RepID=UPI0013C06F5F|nr:hypothetical protein [Moorena sp. SIO3I8]NEO08430.1 hypothetical protein [Moorena sp. SIO3I8]